MDFDTIAAISTPPGEGGIGIIRISGDEAIAIADTLYQMGDKRLSDQPSHTIHYGKLIHPKTMRIIDEVMVTIMKAPKTYTREDVVEINSHGGILVVNKTLQAVLNQGARLAEPGEFTKRAFLNGRIDLSQAEAVMDMIRAKTDKAMHMAAGQLDGRLAELIRELRQDILQTLAQVEVNIDYPEYDAVEEMTSHLLYDKAKKIQKRVQTLLETAEQGKILREGLSTAIIGRPNVGKSSLLNILLKEDKAIVTDIAGTTRDIIEEYVNVRGVPLKLIDTAGIRETGDAVEKIGVQRSRQAIEQADLIILVFDQSQLLTTEDYELIKATAHKKRIIVLNKIDLANKLDVADLKQRVTDAAVIETSMSTQKGLDDLQAHIAKLFFAGETGEKDATYVSNTRHIALLESAYSALDEVMCGIDLGMPVDLVQIDMTRAWDLLGEITGDSIQDELMTQLFSQFCLGK